MNLNTKSIFTLGLAFLIFIITSCNSQQSDKAKQKGNENNTQTKKSDYELAYEFLVKLKNDKTDTIIFYKRTCINCCDFFNIFWSANGQRHLTKFYFDFGDMQTHSKTIKLTNDKILEALHNNFNELKNTSIKDNTHKQKDGTSTLSMIDHYCYAEMSIYTMQDSIITDRMKDHDFDKYTGFGFVSKEKKETNDNYLENKNSHWNAFLTIIENELTKMTETSSKELETLRTRLADN